MLTPANHYNNSLLAPDIKLKSEDYSELMVFHGSIIPHKRYSPIPGTENPKPKRDKPVVNSDYKKYRKPYNKTNIKSSNSDNKDLTADLWEVWTN